MTYEGFRACETNFTENPDERVKQNADWRPKCPYPKCPESHALSARILNYSYAAVC